MIISTCAWCGRGRRRTHGMTGIPGGVDMILESKVYPTVKLHVECAWFLREGLRAFVGEDKLDSKLALELMPPALDKLRRGY